MPSIRLLVFAVTVFVTSALASSAATQTVNIETMADSEPGFGFALAGTLDFERGNSNQTTIGAATQAQVQTVWNDEDPADDMARGGWHRGRDHGRAQLRYTASGGT